MFIAELGKHITSRQMTPKIEVFGDACQVSRLVSTDHLRTFSQSERRFKAGTYYALVAVDVSWPSPILISELVLSCRTSPSSTKSQYVLGSREFQDYLFMLASQWLNSASFSLAIAADLILTVVLIMVLRKSRTGFDQYVIWCPYDRLRRLTRMSSAPTPSSTS